MVQVIGPGKPKSNFQEQLLGGLEQGLNAYQKHQDFRREQSQQKALAQQFPELAGLSPEMQKAALPQLLKGRQGLNPLQKTQQELAQARLDALKGNQELFNKLSGGGKPTLNQQGHPEQQDESLMSAPDDILRQAAAFKGQPGEAGTIGNMAQFEIDRREKEAKTVREDKIEERKYHTGYSKAAEEKANSIRESLPKKEMSLDLARSAVENADLSYFSRDKLADITGSDLFRTAKGAQLVTAAKENLLSSMGRVSARAQNIWFEQRLNSMFPKIGQSREANLTVQEMLEGEAQMDKAYLGEFDRLVKEDESKYGFVRKDIEKRARDAVKPIEKDIMKRTTYRMREIEEQELGLSSIKQKVGKNVIKGTPLTLAMAKLYKEKFKENALDMAEKNGYYIPTIEEFQAFHAQPSEYREALAP